MLSLFEKNIDKAMDNYYEDDSMSAWYDCWDKDYDVVEVDQSEKGHKLKSPFIVKFTVMVRNEKQSQVGTDTITFGVVPGDGDITNGAKIKLLNYDHNEPKENQ